MDVILNNFHFLRPQWFWILIPVVLAYVWLKISGRTFSGWQSVIPPHLYQHMVKGKLEKNATPPFGLLVFTWCVTTLALAGPTWEKLPQPVYQVKQGHVVVIDMSLSMRATDITPDRLTRAKYKAIDLVNAIGEGEMGLVAYAGDSFVISPLTQDASNITALLPSLSPEIMPVPGSDPLLGIESAATLLTNAGYQTGNIYWITDGIEVDQQVELQEYVSGLPFTVNLLAIGTSEGAPIRQVNGELLKSVKGAIVVPTMDASRLRGVASASGGQFATLTPNDGDINSLINASLLERDSDQDESEDNNQGDAWEEVGPYLLLLVLPLAAYGFRKGLIFSLVFFTNALLFVGTVGVVPSAQAQQTASDERAYSDSGSAIPTWQQPFLNQDQEGLHHFDAKNYSAAASTFEDAAWQGAAHYKAGNYEAALAAYSQLDTLDGIYNQGNALAQLGQFDEAIERYQQVLDLDQNHQDAAANKALLEQLQSEQENQNQDDNGDQQNQDSDSEQGEQPNSDQQQDQSSDSSDSQSDESQSQSEDADAQNESEQGDKDDQTEQSPSSETEDNAQQSDAEQQQSQAENEQSEGENPEEQPTSAQASQEELTDEQREQQQRMENLMRRVPDDPAFLLKRKMLLEAQKRQRQRMPANRSEW